MESKKQQQNKAQHDVRKKNKNIHCGDKRARERKEVFLLQEKQTKKT